VEVGDDADYGFYSSLPPSLPMVDVLSYWVFVRKEFPRESLVNE
jgi:hypothetical protein